MTMPDELPTWVYDVIVELQQWAHVHPKLYQQAAGGDYVKADACGCEALELVPAEVRAAAKVYAALRPSIAERDLLQRQRNELLNLLDTLPTVTPIHRSAIRSIFGVDPREPWAKTEECEHLETVGDSTLDDGNWHKRCVTCGATWTEPK